MIKRFLMHDILYLIKLLYCNAIIIDLFISQTRQDFHNIKIITTKVIPYVIYMINVLNLSFAKSQQYTKN